VRPTNSWKIQYMGAFELGRFGSCCTAFSHRKGIEPPGPTLMDLGRATEREPIQILLVSHA
jgi:hypothetical protein